jgi:hypothetical protein
MRVFRNVVKTVKLVIFAGIALVVAFFIGAGAIKKATVSSPPSTTKAPYEVLTSSRLYWGEQVAKQGTTVILTDYWYLQGSRYYFVKGSTDFPTNELAQCRLSAGSTNNWGLLHRVSS